MKISAVMAVATLYLAFPACGEPNTTWSERRSLDEALAYDGTVIRVTEAGYLVGDGDRLISTDTLEPHLTRLLAISQDRHIQFRVYNRERGDQAFINYARAYNHAAKIGFESASAIHGYTDGDSESARATWTYYPSEDITAVGRQFRAEVAAAARGEGGDTLARQP